MVFLYCLPSPFIHCLFKIWVQRQVLCLLYIWQFLRRYFPGFEIKVLDLLFSETHINKKLSPDCTENNTRFGTDVQFRTQTAKWSATALLRPLLLLSINCVVFSARYLQTLHDTWQPIFTSRHCLSPRTICISIAGWHKCRPAESSSC